MARTERSEQYGQAAELVLARYITAARWYYSGLAPNPDTRDRSEEARNLLNILEREALAKTKLETTVVDQEAISGPNRTDVVQLTDEDLKEVLGFEL